MLHQARRLGGAAGFRAITFNTFPGIAHSRVRNSSTKSPQPKSFASRSSSWCIYVSSRCCLVLAHSIDLISHRLPQFSDVKVGGSMRTRSYTMRSGLMKMCWIRERQILFINHFCTPTERRLDHRAHSLKMTRSRRVEAATNHVRSIFKLSLAREIWRFKIRTVSWKLWVFATCCSIPRSGEGAGSARIGTWPTCSSRRCIVSVTGLAKNKSTNTRVAFRPAMVRTPLWITCLN